MLIIDFKAILIGVTNLILVMRLMQAFIFGCKWLYDETYSFKDLNRHYSVAYSTEDFIMHY
jgi:hypothetical protein